MAVTLRAVLQMLQLVDMHNVTAPELLATVGLPAGVTDVETCGDVVAASLEHPDAAVLPGSVKIFTITKGAAWKGVTWKSGVDGCSPPAQWPGARGTCPRVAACERCTSWDGHSRALVDTMTGCGPGGHDDRRAGPCCAVPCWAVLGRAGLCWVVLACT